MAAETRTGAPAAADIAASTSARRGPIRGRFPTTWTATLPIRKPASRTRRAASPRSRTPEAPDHSGSLVPNCEPEVAEPGGREQRVGGGVRDDVGVGVPGQADLAGPEEAAEPQGALGVEGVDVDADADEGEGWGGWEGLEGRCGGG